VSITPLPLLDRQPDQIAYCVPDLDATVERMGRVLGIRDWNVWDYGPDFVPERRFRGEASNYRSLVAMPAFGATLEIIQPLEGPSIYTDFLAERGAGLHHVGYFVPSIADVRLRFQELGLTEVMSGGGHGVDGDGEYVFWDLFDVVGSYVEAIQIPARRRPPHREIHLS
jgi:catechol 2,3-dioxygenase-like lactoylglutathione lyase family enzyme